MVRKLQSKIAVWRAKDISRQDSAAYSQRKETFLMVGAKKINLGTLLIMMYISHRVWKHSRNMV